MEKSKISCIIIDDEDDVREKLAGLLGNLEEIDILSSEGIPEKALEKIIELKPDLVFLDIEMPRMHGFELVKRVREQAVFPTFIFVTAYDQYAIKAIKRDAFDYLLKPVDIEELKQTVERYNANTGVYSSRLINHRLIDSAINTARIVVELIEIHSNQEINYYLPDNVLYLEADGSYTHIYLVEGKKNTICQNLGKTAVYFPSSHFIRVGRKTIVNKKYIKQVRKKEHEMVLEYNGNQTIISTSKKYLPNKLS